MDCNLGNELIFPDEGHRLAMHCDLVAGEISPCRSGLSAQTAIAVIYERTHLSDLDRCACAFARAGHFALQLLHLPRLPFKRGKEVINLSGLPSPQAAIILICEH